MGPTAYTFYVCDPARLLPLGMVEQVFAVPPKLLFQPSRIGGADAGDVDDPLFSQAPCYLRADLSNIGNRLMEENLPFDGFLIQHADAVRGLLRLDVQGHLRQGQVGPDSCSRGYACFLQNLGSEHLRELFRTHAVEPQVGCCIDEALVDGVHVHALWADVPHVNGVDFRRCTHVPGHSRGRHRVGDGIGHLENPTAVFRAEPLHRWRYRQTYGSATIAQPSRHTENTACSLVLLRTGVLVYQVWITG